MGRNIVPRANKDADLGTSAKNWNTLYTDAIKLRNNDLQALLDAKTNLNTLTAKGDLYVATDAGIVTRLPRGADGEVLVSNSQTTEGLDWVQAGLRRELTSNLTVTVGSGGDFPTINAALAHVVSTYYPVYLSTGVVPRVTIQLQSGFVMAEQVLIESLDLSWITITGIDAETVINRSALTKNFYGEGYPAFGVAYNGVLPIIRQLFNMNSLGDGSSRHGIIGVHSAVVNVFHECGIKNASGDGIKAVHACRCSLVDAIFSGAGSHGIRAFGNSFVNAPSTDVSGSGDYGIFVQSGSIVNAKGAIGTLNQAANIITGNGIIFQ